MNGLIKIIRWPILNGLIVSYKISCADNFSNF